MKTFLAAVLLGFTLACAAQPAVAPRNGETHGETHGVTHGETTARPQEWASPVDASRNLYRITPTLYRSAQPVQSDAAWIKRLGIRTIINFRVYHKDEDVLNLPDVKLVRVPMDTNAINDEHIVSALRAIAEAQQDGPVLIHCWHGADRTGTVAAMYRILEQGWTREQALRELKEGNYGYHAIWTNIPRYIERANIDTLRARLRK